MSHISYGTRLVPQLTPRSSMLVLTCAVGGYEPNGKIWPLKVQWRGCVSCLTLALRDAYRIWRVCLIDLSRTIEGCSQQPA